MLIWFSLRIPVRVDVSDVNEYPPRFPADSVRASVAEEEAVGSEVKCGIKKVKTLGSINQK